MIKEKIKNSWLYFSTYEKIWFFSILTASIILTFVFPSEETQTPLLTVCVLLSVLGNITCELLLSKQSKWNFIISIIFVEITETIIFFVLGWYASASISIVFWIPIDVISFINWNKNKDESKNEITIVKKLNWWQDIIIVCAIIIFGLGVGYILTLIPGAEDTYLDAFCSAVGMVNGICILLRLREQWIAWFIYTILEAILWILAGQWAMLVLTVGFLTNTTYGFIKWTLYIKNRNTAKVVCKDIKK